MSNMRVHDGPGHWELSWTNMLWESLNDLRGGAQKVILGVVEQYAGWPLKNCLGEFKKNTPGDPDKSELEKDV